MNTTQNCASCSHANVCQEKNIFNAMQHYTDLLVKTPLADKDGAIRETIRVRVEYRYVNGPELERLYRELGMEGYGQVPCGAPGHRYCPLMRRFPFDNPIYAPFPHVAATVTDIICHGAHNHHNERMPYYMETFSAGKLGNCHVSHYAGKSWWSCRSCKVRGNPNAEIDFAQLGGTVYSTFYHTTIEGKVGDTIKLHDLPIPKDLSPDYAPSLTNPEYFTLKSEEETIIVYYDYIGLPEPVIPDDAPPATPEMADVRIVTNEKFLYYSPVNDVGNVIIVLRSGDYNGNCRQYDRVIFNSHATHGMTGTYMVGTFAVGTKLTFDLILENMDWAPHRNAMRVLMDMPGLKFVERSLRSSSGTNRASFLMTMTVQPEMNVIRPVFTDVTKLREREIALFDYWHFGSIDDGGMYWDYENDTPDVVIPKLIKSHEWEQTVPPHRLYSDILPDGKVVQRDYFKFWGYTMDILSRAMYQPVTYANPEVLNNATAIPFVTWYGNDDALLTSLPSIPNFKNTECGVAAMWMLESAKVAEAVGKALSADDNRFPNPSHIPLVHDYSVDGHPSEQMAQRPVVIRRSYHPGLATEYKDDITAAIPTGFDAYILPIPETVEDEGPILGVMAKSVWPQTGSPSNERSVFVPEVHIRYVSKDQPDTLTEYDWRDLYNLSGHAEKNQKFTVTKRAHLIPLEDWNPTVMDLASTRRFILFMVPNPTNQMGIDVGTVNFSYLELVLRWDKQPTSITFFQKGSKKLLATPTSQPTVMLSDVIGHALSDIFPEDAEEVMLSKDENDASESFFLAGPKAVFYVLNNVANVEQVEPATLRGFLEGGLDVNMFDSITTMVPYKGHMTFNISAPPGKALTNIMVSLPGTEEKGEFVISIVDRIDGVETVLCETVEGIDVAVEGLNGDGNYTISLDGVDAPIEILTYWTTSKYINTGAECDRCKDFIEASAYPNIDWTPTCKNYAE